VDEPLVQNLGIAVCSSLYHPLTHRRLVVTRNCKAYGLPRSSPILYLWKHDYHVALPVLGRTKLQKRLERNSATKYAEHVGSVFAM